MQAQGVLHARWMDWVINGDKYRVEYCFCESATMDKIGDGD